MGQKVHPYGFRVGYNKDWHTHWYAKHQFAEFLAEDLKLKRELKNKFGGGGVSHIDIERAATRLKIIIYGPRARESSSAVKVLRSKSCARIMPARPDAKCSSRFRKSVTRN